MHAGWAWRQGDVILRWTQQWMRRRGLRATNVAPNKYGIVPWPVLYHRAEEKKEEGEERRRSEEGEVRRRGEERKREERSERRRGEEVKPQRRKECDEKRRRCEAPERDRKRKEEI